MSEQMVTVLAFALGWLVALGGVAHLIALRLGQRAATHVVPRLVRSEHHIADANVRVALFLALLSSMGMFAGGIAGWFWLIDSPLPPFWRTIVLACLVGFGWVISAMLAVIHWDSRRLLALVRSETQAQERT